MRVSRSIILASSLLITVSGHAGVVTSELRQAMQGLPPDAEVAVIVKLRAKANVKALQGTDKKARRSALVKKLRQMASGSQGGVRTLLSGRGGREVKELWLINGVSARVPVHLVAKLASRQDVESVRLDAVVAAPAPAAAVAELPEWNLTAIKADTLWAAGHTGQGVVVGSLDSGVDPNHQDLASKWRGGANSWFDPNGQYASPSDNHGHGTQTMGIIVGGGGGGSAIGVAPGARWIAAKIFNDADVSSLSAIHQSFQWMLDPDGNPDVDDAPDIVNNSWGLLETVGGCDVEFAADIQALKAADIAVVFSSGNDGPNAGTSLSPANYADSVSTGAVNSQQVVANFSGRGPSACDGGVYPRIAAPGVNIKTADLTFGGIIPGAYIYVDGTSFAAAHVSGAMALLRGAHTTATVANLESALTQTAFDLGAAGPDNDYGWGLLDVAAASAALDGGGGPVPQPGSLRFDVASYDVAEEAGTLTITVNRTGGSSGAATVDYATAGGTALAGADYVAAAGTLSFADGQTTGSLTVSPLDDSAFEGSETFNISLLNPAGGAAPGISLTPPSTATITITDTVDTPADQDRDGYNVTTDCNDNDPSIHPGALEIKRDGVDQDCNGYDLTIVVTKAEYVVNRRQLTIESTSALGSGAKLQVQGFGAMQWIATARLWRLRITTNVRPATVTVMGREGSESAAIRYK